MAYMAAVDGDDRQYGAEALSRHWRWLGRTVIVRNCFSATGQLSHLFPNLLGKIIRLQRHAFMPTVDHAS
jgi:hypothetical protein